jgi:multidrug efflux pump subunit AcrA (membrane-fusion protein)
MEGEKNYVYARSGNSYRKKEVVIGQRNNDFVIIQEGLDPDEVLALSNPYPEEKRTGNKMIADEKN